MITFMSTFYLIWLLIFLVTLVLVGLIVVISNALHEARKFFKGTPWTKGKER